MIARVIGSLKPEYSFYARNKNAYHLFNFSSRFHIFREFHISL